MQHQFHLTFAIIICCSLFCYSLESIVAPMGSDHALENQSRVKRKIAPSLHVFAERGLCNGVSSDLTDCQRYCQLRRFPRGGCNFNRNACICSDRNIDFETYEGENKLFI